MANSQNRSDRKLASDAWESLMTLHARMTREFHADKIWQDVSPREYDVLYQLSKHANPQRICDLQQAVVLSQPALSRLVERLEQRGFVSRRTSQHDARSVLVELTDLGVQTQREIGKLHANQISTALLARGNHDDLEALERACQAFLGPKRAT